MGNILWFDKIMFKIVWCSYMVWHIMARLVISRARCRCYKRWPRNSCQESVANQKGVKFNQLAVRLRKKERKKETRLRFSERWQHR